MMMALATAPAGFAARVNGRGATTTGGFPAGDHWSVTSGSLPSGLAVAGSSTPGGTITGTPTQAGTYTFTLTVTDANTPPDTAQETGTIVVTDPQYLAQPYVAHAQFKKLPDASGWDPTQCRADEAR